MEKEIMDVMNDTMNESADLAEVTMDDMLPTVEEATANAVGTFGVKEGLVVGFFITGLACMGYTAYDLGYKKLIKGKVIPYFQQKKALKEAMEAGAAEAAKKFQAAEAVEEVEEADEEG